MYKKIYYGIIITIGLLNVGNINAHGQTPGLDINFGQQGISTLSPSAEIYDMVQLPNKQIISAGVTKRIGTTDQYDLSLHKINESGQLITSFGNQGITTLPIQASCMPLAVKILSNGDIMVVGSSYSGHTPTGPGLHYGFISKFNSNGQLDNSFGQQGTYLFYYGESHFTSIIPIDNQSFYAVGNIALNGCLVKIKSNGTIDNTFGSGGIKILNDANHSLAIWDAIKLKNGHLLAIGFDITDPNNAKSAVLKMDANSNFVTNFGNNGFLTFDIHNNIMLPNEYIFKALELPDQSCLLLGQVNESFLLHIDKDGNFINNFGNNGQLKLGSSYVDFALDQFEKIWLTASTIITDYNYGLKVSKLNIDGTWDLSFNQTGHYAIDISPNSDHAQKLLLNDPNAIIIAGAHKITGQSQGAIFKLWKDKTTAINTIDHADTALFYPNPFSSQLNYKGSLQEIHTITMYNADGKKIIAVTNPAQLQSQLSALPNGIYLMHWQDKKGTAHTQQLIKKY